MRESIIIETAAAPLTGGLTQPFKIASGSHDKLRNAVIRIKLACGIEGFGEAGVASHVTGETRQLTHGHLLKAGEKITGKSAADYLLLSESVRDIFQDNHAGLAALEMAVLDALAKLLGFPLWKFFGNQCSLPQTDMTVVIGGVEEARESALAIRGRGIKNLKIKIGINEEEDFLRLKAIHEAVPECRMYLDANQGYNADQSLRLLKRLQKAGITPSLIEQPASKEDFEGLKKVTRVSSVPVCADESAGSLEDVVRLIKGKAVDAVNIKLAKFGLLKAREAALLCRAAGMDMMIGEMMESLLSSSCAAQFAAGIRGFKYVDLDTPLFVKEKIMKGDILSPDGFYHLKKIKTGLGVVPAKQIKN